MATKDLAGRKVTIVTTLHESQDDRIYYKQALSLAKRMEVAIIAPDIGRDLEWASTVSYHSIPKRRGLIGRLRSLIDATLAARSEKPDFCHLHDLDLALALPLLRLLTNAKLIYDSHEVFTQEDLLLNESIPKAIRPAVAYLVNLAERLLLRFCDHIVVAVEPDGGPLTKLRLPLTVIYNYPPLRLFETDPLKLEGMRQQVSDHLPIIYQGTFSRDRGLFHMIAALAIIRRSEPRILLKLVGMTDKELMSETRRHAEELGVRDAIQISGWLPHNEMAYEMKTSLIGLVPLQPSEKYKRSVPIKLLEYMACGLPVIAADLPLIRKYVEDSGAGLLYDSTRPEELARHVLELLHDSNRRGQMSENGLRAVRERWNWDQMEVVLNTVYDSLCTGENRAMKKVHGK